MIIHGGSLLFFIVSMAIMYICVSGALKLKIPMEIRRIPQLDQMDEMVKTAAELGRPVLIPVGGLLASDSYTPAWCTIFRRVGEMAAGLNVRVVTSTYMADTAVVVEDYIREGYVRAGHPERYRPDDNLCILGGTFTWSQGTIGLSQRVRPGAVFMMGLYDWDSHVNILKTLSTLPGKPVMMGGGGWVDNVADCAVFCDYMMLGDQHVAAQAILSGDPWHPPQTVGLDIIKLMFVALPIIAFIAAVLKIPFVEYF